MNPLPHNENAEPGEALVEFVRVRTAGQTHRFLSAGRGGLTVHVADLVELVTEIVAEHTAHLTAERDALAEELARHRNTYRDIHSRRSVAEEIP